MIPSSLSLESLFICFVCWIFAGMGLRIGWGLIELIVGMAANALGRNYGGPMPPR
jgi:hypothetical protein